MVEFRRPYRETRTYKESKRRESWDMPHRPDWEVRMPPVGHDDNESDGGGSRNPMNAQPPRMPETICESLLMAAPNQEPLRSAEEAEGDETPLTDLLGDMDEVDQLIVRSIVFEKMSGQQVADAYGFPHRTWVHRRWHKIRQTMIDHLEETNGEPGHE